MEEGLAEILDVADVKACLLFDNQGNVLREMAQVDLHPDQIQEIGSLVLPFLAALETENGDYTDVEYVFERSRVVLKDLEKAVLVVICQLEVDISLLRLTMNVVMNQWDESPQVRKFLKTHQKPRLDGEVIG